ncbi:AraC family transcriptional regulator N-terminal domain-containing protein [Sphingobacterium multivorum]|uniref:AraC family transcriptional regulator N-terminal domain-containing protein n=1 Tax=Sphingobacterium multivorum TaxID=28454 RepID=UPI002FDA8C88
MKSYRITPVNLSDSSKLHSRLEHRRTFNLPNCELNIFETFHKSDNVILSYSGGLVVSSMMRGKKVMSVDGQEAFDFLPGQSVILPDGLTMNVGFPDADENRPVQCITLTLDWDTVHKNLDYLNERYSNHQAPFEWKLDFSHQHFQNSMELVTSLNKLVNLSMEEGFAKEAIADLSLKVLLLRLLQTQNRLSVNSNQPMCDNRIQPAINYVHKHLTEKITVEKLARECCLSQSSFYQYFKNILDITPLEFVLRTRIDHAKK